MTWCAEGERKERKLAVPGQPCPARERPSPHCPARPSFPVQPCEAGPLVLGKKIIFQKLFGPKFLFPEQKGKRLAKQLCSDRALTSCRVWF